VPLGRASIAFDYFGKGRLDEVPQGVPADAWIDHDDGDVEIVERSARCLSSLGGFASVGTGGDGAPAPPVRVATPDAVSGRRTRAERARACVVGAGRAATLTLWSCCACIDRMHLTRCTDQSSKTLDEFYGQATGHDDVVVREGGRAMLDLIARLCALPDERRVWGLTSHQRLCLLSSDTSASPWYVIVAALNHRNNFIEYLMPSVSAPWTNAYVRGEARSEDQAIEMVITAMDRSGGWRDVEPHP
jgi:hypothetical protein